MTRRSWGAVGLVVAFAGCWLLPARGPAQVAARPGSGPGSRPEARAEKTTEAAPRVRADILEAAFAPTRDEVFAHVRFLASDAMRGRRSGSDEGRRAAEAIAAHFEGLGLKPGGPTPDGEEHASFFQPFERVQLVASIVDGEQQIESRKVGCNNVLAWLEGTAKDGPLSEEYILIAAHFDHIGARGGDVFNGADDNASGTAGLLEIARAMVLNEDVRPRRSVLFCAFDAEESGLLGAQHYVRHPARSVQQLAAMINLDMIGRGKLLDRKSMAFAKKIMGITEPAMGVLGPSRCPELGAIAREVFAAEEYPLYAPTDFGMLGNVIRKQAEGRADHAPFEQRRVPFLFFSNSEHDDYHQATDTIDKLDADALHRATRAIYRTLLAIDALDQRPVFVDEAKDVPAEAGAKKADSGK